MRKLSSGQNINALVGESSFSCQVNVCVYFQCTELRSHGAWGLQFLGKSHRGGKVSVANSRTDPKQGHQDLNHPDNPEAGYRVSTLTAFPEFMKQLGPDRHRGSLLATCLMPTPPYKSGHSHRVLSKTS